MGYIEAARPGEHHGRNIMSIPKEYLKVCLLSVTAHMPPTLGQLNVTTRMTHHTHAWEVDISKNTAIAFRKGKRKKT